MKIPKVEKLDETHYRVSVTAPPTDGRANDAVIESLADHFGIKKYLITIRTGLTSRDKIVEIED